MGSHKIPIINSTQIEETDLIPAISHFHAGVCAICYVKEDSSCKLLRCGQCQLVSYCSKDCQKKDWKIHKFLCSVNKIQNSRNVFGSAKEMLSNSEDSSWVQIRTGLSVATVINLRRSLTVRESEIILFPKVCEVCKESDASLLSTCSDCFSIFYCSDGHQSQDEANHKLWCSEYLLCLECDTYEALNGIRDLPFPTDVDLIYSKLPRDLKSLLEPQMNVTKELDNRFVTMIYERLSYPLSLLYALEKLMLGPDQNNIMSLTSLKIHIIGAESLTELLGLIRWEYMLHRLPSLETFHVVFIGPDLMTLSENEEVSDKHCIEDTGMTRCPDCQQKERLVIYEMASMTYHEYAETDHYSLPDAIVAFNCGFHEHIGKQEDTWMKSLELLTQSNIPLIFTSYTKLEAEKDLATVKQAATSDNIHVIIDTHLNPFRASRPMRCPEREEGRQIFYNNQYLTSVRSIGS